MWTNPYLLAQVVEQYQQDLMDNARRWHLARGGRRERRADRGHRGGHATRNSAGSGRSDRGAVFGARTALRSGVSATPAGVGTLAVCGRPAAESVR